MTGKDVILQYLSDNEEKLAEACNRVIECPRDVGLRNRCGRHCESCWLMAMDDKIE